MTTCIQGKKGKHSFCGKKECVFHYEHSFASFQGMVCGASSNYECITNGVLNVQRCKENKK